MKNYKLVNEMTNTKMLKATASLFIVLASISACAKGNKDEKAKEGKEAASSGAAQAVSVSQISQMNISPNIVVAGQVQAQNEARIFPTSSGARVIQLLVDAGSYVQAGQPLAKLDAKQISADSELLSAQVRRARSSLAEAEVGLKNAQETLNRSINGPKETSLSLEAAQYAYNEAKSQYDRAMATGEMSALSREEIERRRTAMETALARLNSQKGDIAGILEARRQAVAQANARLGAAKSDLAVAVAQQSQSESRQNGGIITSPVSGLVTSRNVMVGEIAGASGQPMFTIVASGALEVAAEISESEISRLKQGMSAQFTAPDGSMAYGTLRLLPAQIDPQKRTGIAKFTLQPNPSIKAGVFLTGNASIGNRDISAIPSSALLFDKDGASVFVALPNNKVTKQKVTLGARQGDIVELIAGPAVGSWIVTSGASFLAEGQKINPIKTAANSNPAPAANPATTKK